MKNTKLIIILLAILAAIAVYFLVLRKPATQTLPLPKAEIPVNIIPISNRPFVTLTPDTSGRTLTLTIDNITYDGVVEYELVYDTVSVQEGAFGRIDLSKETQPVEKDLLLGSRSAGGAVTYNEGVTGGYLTLTYDEIKLREDFEFLRFNSKNPSYISQDGIFEVTFASKALRSNDVIVIMKSFGLPQAFDGESIAGPYVVRTAKGVVPSSVSIQVEESESELSIYEYADDGWVMVESTTDGMTISSSKLSGTLFLISISQ